MTGSAQMTAKPHLLPRADIPISTIRQVCGESDCLWRDALVEFEQPPEAGIDVLEQSIVLGNHGERHRCLIQDRPHLSLTVLD